MYMHHATGLAMESQMLAAPTDLLQHRCLLVAVDRVVYNEQAGLRGDGVAVVVSDVVSVEVTVVVGDVRRQSAKSPPVCSCHQSTRASNWACELVFYSMM